MVGKIIYEGAKSHEYMSVICKRCRAYNICIYVCKNNCILEESL